MPEMFYRRCTACATLQKKCSVKPEIFAGCCRSSICNEAVIFVFFTGNLFALKHAIFFLLGKSTYVLSLSNQYNSVRSPSNRSIAEIKATPTKTSRGKR